MSESKVLFSTIGIKIGCIRYPRMDMGAMTNAFRALVIFLSGAARDPMNLFSAKNKSQRNKNNKSIADFTVIKVGKDYIRQTYYFTNILICNVSIWLIF